MFWCSNDSKCPASEKIIICELGIKSANFLISDGGHIKSSSPPIKRVGALIFLKHSASDLNAHCAANCRLRPANDFGHKPLAKFYPYGCVSKTDGLLAQRVLI